VSSDFTAVSTEEPSPWMIFTIFIVRGSTIRLYGRPIVPPVPGKIDLPVASSATS